MNTKQILKSVAVASSAMAIAFFSYRVYKTYKMVKAELEFDEKMKTQEKPPQTTYIPPKVITPPVVLNAVEDENELPTGIYASEEDMFAADEEAGVYLDPEEEEDYLPEEVEEVEELRFPPNSKEALHQFEDWQLAEFQEQSPEWRALIRVSTTMFKPTNKQDQAIFDNLVREREAFFGVGSIWNHKISLTDLILYYANLLDFDLDGGVVKWASFLLRNLGITSGIGELALEGKALRIFTHTHSSAHGYGMFGLSPEAYREMLEQVTNTTYSYLTFNAQYHTFVAWYMDGDLHGEEPEEMEYYEEEC